MIFKQTWWLITVPEEVHPFQKMVSEIFLLEYHSERQRWMNETGVFKLDSLLGKLNELPL